VTPEAAGELLARLGGLWPDHIEDPELSEFDSTLVRQALYLGSEALLPEPEELELHLQDDTDPFEAYFNVADEIYEGLALTRHRLDQRKPGFEQAHLTDREIGYVTLADLDSDWVATARRFVDEYKGQDGPPWPPYLPWAEEYSNDLRLAEFHKDRNWEGV